MAAWPSAFRLSRGGTDGDGDSPWAFLAGAGGGQVIGQVVLTGGPVVLALAGGSPAEVTALFAGLALFRAPYTLGAGAGLPAHRLVQPARRPARHRRAAPAAAAGGRA